MRGTTALEGLLRRDRMVVFGGLAAVIALAWAYILLGAGMGTTAFEMTAMSGMGGAVAAAMAPVAWTPSYAVLMVFMWWIMMVAMMLPAAAPTVLVFAAINRRRRENAEPAVATAVFAAGYLLAWGGFSVAAAALQWALGLGGLLSPAMASTSVALGGGLLIAAGVYQLTPLKYACLRRCRSPLHFVLGRWRAGAAGAFVMGVEHGAFCLGCCWVLMALLFYGGVMNLYWIVGLAVYVVLEKTLPADRWPGRLTGAALIVWGGALIAVQP